MQGESNGKSKMAGIKLIHKNQTKRINENIENFDTLIELVKSVFNFGDELNDVKNHIILFYFSVDNLGERTQILDDKTYYRFLSSHNKNCLKLYLELNTEIEQSQYVVKERSNKDVIDYKTNDEFLLVKQFVNEIIENSAVDLNYNLDNKKFVNSSSFSDPGNLNKILPINKFNSDMLCIEKPSNSNIELRDANIEKKFIRDSQNNIKLQGSNLEFVDISKDSSPPDAIFNDICSICSRNIFFNKFLCCICNNMAACENCEPTHFHPMIKFKSAHISSKEEILNLVISQQEIKTPELTKNVFRRIREISESIFEKKFKLRTHVFTNYISVRPYKKFKIPFYIYNESDMMPRNKLLVLTRNNKDLIVTPYLVDFDLHPREKCEIFLECESKEQIKIHDFEIFLYHPNAKIDCESVDIKIEINLDQEEESLNEYFSMFPILTAIPKNQKEIMYKIIKEGISTKHPIVIYNIMIKYDWNVDEAIDELNMEFELISNNFNSEF